MVPMDLTDYTVIEVTMSLSRGVGPGGTYSVSLQHWFIWFGEASGELRLIVAEFYACLENERSPWDAYRALMSGRLIGLDKNLGVRPVVVG